MGKYVPNWYSVDESINHVSYLGGGKIYDLKFVMGALLSCLHHGRMPKYYSSRLV
jgi:hypothetical protein